MPSEVGLLKRCSHFAKTLLYKLYNSYKINFKDICSKVVDNLLVTFFLTVNSIKSYRFLFRSSCSVVSRKTVRSCCNYSENNH